MVNISIDEKHIKACNELIKNNNLKLKNDKNELEIEDIREIFKKVSKKQY